MEIEGMIIRELPIRQGSTERGPWKVASYVLETLESYPRRICFDVMDGSEGRIARLNIKAGKRMKIYFDINAHESQGRWFNSIRAFDAKDISYLTGMPSAAPNNGENGPTNA
jgi:hypothetical protein